MPRITITRELAHAAASDAGNRSKRKGRRSRWNEDDWNAACDEFERLWSNPLKAEYDLQHPELTP